MAVTQIDKKATKGSGEGAKRDYASGWTGTIPESGVYGSDRNKIEQHSRSSGVGAFRS